MSDFRHRLDLIQCWRKSFVTATQGTGRKKELDILEKYIRKIQLEINTIYTINNIYSKTNKNNKTKMF